MIRLSLVGDRFRVELSPPHGNEPWASDSPLTEREAAAELERRGCHPRDVWDSIAEAQRFGIGGYGFEGRLSAPEAYDVMLCFLHGYFERTGSDELGGLLGGFARSSDGTPMDPAAQDDWERAIREVRGRLD